MFTISPDDYGEKYYEHLIQEYRLYVEMMDNTSERRSKANTFFLSINSALIAIMGILTKISAQSSINLIWIVISAIFGILLCKRWSNIIQSYSDLNTGRFAIIHLLEEKLPAKLFKAEWDYLRPSEGQKKYEPLTVTESKVPQLFVYLYIILAIIGGVSFILEILNLIPK